jgi:anti-sigma28 factor (negative regulator of flagellin synthesis)
MMMGRRDRRVSSREIKISAEATDSMEVSDTMQMEGRQEAGSRLSGQAKRTRDDGVNGTKQIALSTEEDDVNVFGKMSMRIREGRVERIRGWSGAFNQEDRKRSVSWSLTRSVGGWIRRGARACSWWAGRRGVSSSFSGAEGCGRGYGIAREGRDISVGAGIGCRGGRRGRWSRGGGGSRAS